VLTKTSAELRGIGQGGTIEFAGGEILDVVGVVSDQSGAGAEIVVDLNSGTALGVIVDRFLLARLTGQRSTVEASLRGVLDPSAPLRVRTSGESPFLRHGDAVLTQAAIKSAFGEFSYRLAEGRSVELDPAWVADNIVDEEVPLLGTVTCHRDFIPALSQALARIESDNLGHLIDPTQFAGCFSPRRIGAGLPLSHHAWGVAIDLNIGDNPRGSFSTQDPSLVAALTDVGMGWGGEWLVPDPGHYEVISP
ncbi:MAG: M15 family metallopeptidase, partial [Acidimicrobiales bacterium]